MSIRVKQHEDLERVQKTINICFLSGTMMYRLEKWLFPDTHVTHVHKTVLCQEIAMNIVQTNQMQTFTIYHPYDMLYHDPSKGGNIILYCTKVTNKCKTYLILSCLLRGLSMFFFMEVQNIRFGKLLFAGIVVKVFNRHTMANLMIANIKWQKHREER